MQSIEYLELSDLKVYQDDDLYHFTSDAIMLTKFTSVKKGDVVADFCSGSGIVGFHLYGLNPVIKSVTFFEMQKPLFDLSVKSIELNNLQDKFKKGTLEELNFSHLQFIYPLGWNEGINLFLGGYTMSKENRNIITKVESKKWLSVVGFLISVTKLYETSDEWIYSRTGIKERRVCVNEKINVILHPES